MIIYRYGNIHNVDLRKTKTIISNLGEASDWLCGEPKIGVVDLDSMEIELINLK